MVEGEFEIDEFQACYDYLEGGCEGEGEGVGKENTLTPPPPDWEFVVLK
jgi:hypothetical protein